MVRKAAVTFLTKISQPFNIVNQISKLVPKLQNMTYQQCKKEANDFHLLLSVSGCFPHSEIVWYFCWIAESLDCEMVSFFINKVNKSAYMHSYTDTCSDIRTLIWNELISMGALMYINGLSNDMVAREHTYENIFWHR